MCTLDACFHLAEALLSPAYAAARPRVSTCLQVTFAVLVFPPEHHAIGFAVASAATGSCVLKLGLGWLLGESGEIFKILDDPLGDRCHVSRFVV